MLSATETENARDKDASFPSLSRVDRRKRENERVSGYLTGECLVRTRNTKDEKC